MQLTDMLDEIFAGRDAINRYAEIAKATRAQANGNAVMVAEADRIDGVIARRGQRVRDLEDWL